MPTVNSFLKLNSKDVFQAAAAGTQKPIQNADFLSYIPEPLQSFSFIQFLIQLEQSLSSSSSLSKDKIVASELIDEFEIAAREHVLSLSHVILQSNHDAAIVEETIEELLSFIRNIIDVILHILYIHVTNNSTATATADDNINQVKSGLYEKLIGSLNFRKLPFLILEDLIDTLPTQTIQCFWNYGPSSWLNNILCKNPLKVINLPKSCNNNIKTEDVTLFHQTSQYCVLRFCNKLLKNLSVAGSNTQAQFAGQITMTLASVFPLSERSGMNVLGAFNVDNVVEYETLDEWLKTNNDNNNATNDSNKSIGHNDKGGGGTLNYDFYQTFWSLQNTFTDPTTLLKFDSAGGSGWNENGMETFIKNVEIVLQAFDTNKFPTRLIKDLKHRWNDAKKRPISDKYTLDSEMAMDVDDNEQAFIENPLNNNSAASKKLSSRRQNKYMTNSQLLHLQIKDPEVRIHILTQLFIITAYLSHSISSNVAMNRMTVKRVCDNLTSLEERAGELLKETPPNGQIQYNTLKWILNEREIIWRDWKKMKCEPNIAKKHSPNDSKEAVREEEGTSNENNKSTLASISNHYTFKVDKARLCSISMAITKEYTPNYAEFLEDYVEALDPEAGIEEEYHPRNDKLFTWRAMRLLNDKHIGRLGVDEKGFKMIDLSSGDFEGLVRKIWKEEKGIDIPGEMPMETTSEELLLNDEANKEENDEEMKAEIQEQEKNCVDGEEQSNEEQDNNDNDDTEEATHGKKTDDGIVRGKPKSTEGEPKTAADGTHVEKRNSDVESMVKEEVTATDDNTNETTSQSTGHKRKREDDNDDAKGQSQQKEEESKSNNNIVSTSKENASDKNIDEKDDTKPTTTQTLVSQSDKGNVSQGKDNQQKYSKNEPSNSQRRVQERRGSGGRDSGQHQGRGSHNNREGPPHNHPPSENVRQSRGGNRGGERRFTQNNVQPNQGPRYQQQGGRRYNPNQRRGGGRR